ncbi:MAG: polyprenol monophosphomannose synthase, partial [Spirochaetota bacterium]|nr:polyprenol monophosphomannose synthase [Spirochaetota bacterium]
QIFAYQPEFNVIVVDDKSPDGTGDILDRMAANDNRIHVIHGTSKSGLGTACIKGFKYALSRGDADYIFEMDGDGSHSPEFLRDFIQASEDYDLIIGSRYYNGIRVEGWNFRSLVISKLANIYISRIMLRPIWDFTSGFRCYKSKMLETINLDQIKSEGYLFQIEMIHRSFKQGFRIIELPIIFREKKNRYSKISENNISNTFWTVLKWHAPIRKMIRYRSIFRFQTRPFFTRISKDQNW